MSRSGGAVQQLNLDPSSLNCNENLLAILHHTDDDLFTNNSSITPDSSAVGSATSRHTADSAIFPNDSNHNHNTHNNNYNSNHNNPQPNSNSRPINPSLLLNPSHQSSQRYSIPSNNNPNIGGNSTSTHPNPTNSSPYNNPNTGPLPKNPLEPLSFQKVEIENAATSAALQHLHHQQQQQQQQQQSLNKPIPMPVSNVALSGSMSPTLAATTTTVAPSTTSPTSTTTLNHPDPLSLTPILNSNTNNDNNNNNNTTSTNHTDSIDGPPPTSPPIPINPLLHNLQGSSNLRRQLEMNKNIPPVGFGGAKPKTMIDPFGRKQENVLSRDPIIIPGVGIVDVSQYENKSSLLYCTVFFPSLPRMADQDIFFSQIRLPTDQTIKTLILTSKQQFHDNLLRIRAFTPGHVDSCLAAHIQSNILKRRRQQLLREDNQVTIFSDPRYHVAHHLDHNQPSYYNSALGIDGGHLTNPSTLQSMVQPQPQPLMISQSSNINTYEPPQQVHDPNLNIIYSKPPGYNPLLHTQRFQGELHSIDLQQVQLEQTAHNNELRNQQIAQQQQQQQQQYQQYPNTSATSTGSGGYLSVNLADGSHPGYPNNQPTSTTPTNQQQQQQQQRGTPQQPPSSSSLLKKKQPMPGAIGLPTSTTTTHPPTPTSLSHSLTTGLSHSTSNLSSSTASHSGSAGPSSPKDALTRTQPLPLQQIQQLQQMHQNRHSVSNQPELGRRYTVDGLEGGGSDGYNNNPRSYYPPNQSLLTTTHHNNNNNNNQSFIQPTFSFDLSASDDGHQPSATATSETKFQQPNSSTARAANLSGPRSPIPTHRVPLHASNSFNSQDNPAAAQYQQSLPKRPTPSHSGSQFLSVHKPNVLDGLSSGSSGGGSVNTALTAPTSAGNNVTRLVVNHHGLDEILEGTTPSTSNTRAPPLQIAQFSHSSSHSSNNDDDIGELGASVRIGRFSIQNIAPSSPVLDSSPSPSLPTHLDPTSVLNRRSINHQHSISATTTTATNTNTPAEYGTGSPIFSSRLHPQPHQHNFPPSPNHHNVGHNASSASGANGGNGANPLASSGTMIYSSNSVLQPLSQSFPFQDSCPLDPSFLIEDIFGDETDASCQYQLCVWDEDQQQIDGNFPPLLDFTKLTHISHESFALVRVTPQQNDDNGKSDEVDRYGRRKLKGPPLDLLRKQNSGGSTGGLSSDSLGLNPALFGLGGGDSNLTQNKNGLNPSLPGLGGGGGGGDSGTTANNNTTTNDGPQINPLLLQRGRGSTDRYGAVANRGAQQLGPGLTAADISFSSHSSNHSSQTDTAELVINPALLGLDGGGSGRQDEVKMMNLLPQRTGNRYGPPGQQQQQQQQPQPGSVSSTSSDYGFANTGGTNQQLPVKQGLNGSTSDDNGSEDDDENLFTIHKAKDNKLIKTPPQSERTATNAMTATTTTTTMTTPATSAAPTMTTMTTTTTSPHLKNKNIDLSISGEGFAASPSPSRNTTTKRRTHRTRSPDKSGNNRSHKSSNPNNTNTTSNNNHHNNPSSVPPSPISQSRPRPPQPKRSWFSRVFSCFSSDNKSILEDDFGYRNQELQNTLDQHAIMAANLHRQHDPFSIDTDESDVDVDVYVTDQRQIKSEMMSIQQHLQTIEQQQQQANQSLHRNDPDHISQQQSPQQSQSSQPQLFPPTVTRMASLSHSSTSHNHSSMSRNQHRSPSVSGNNNTNNFQSQPQPSHPSSQVDNEYEHSASNSDISFDEIEFQ